MDNVTRTAKDLIIKLAGGEVQVNKLLASIRENRRKLDSCEIHDFSIDLVPDKPITIGNKWRCSNCGGEVDSLAKKWYELGKEHQWKVD